MSKLEQQSQSSRMDNADSNGTWISIEEAALIMHVDLKIAIKRAEHHRINAKINPDVPLTNSGKTNYVVCLESLAPEEQLEYLKLHLPDQQRVSLDLAAPRFQDIDWKNHLNKISELLGKAATISTEFTHKGKSTEELKSLAEECDMSLASLYRFRGRASSKEMSKFYPDPIYMQKHLPKTMCLWSVDLTFYYYLDVKCYSQNSILEEVRNHADTPCERCPYFNENHTEDDFTVPICHLNEKTMRVPNNRRTINRLVSHLPASLTCYARRGYREWRSIFGAAVIRYKPLCVGELIQGDHHVFDAFVRVTVKVTKNDKVLEQEIAVRPVLTAWMDTATGCLVGWYISILPNADTIAEAFCRAVTFTVGDEFHGLPKRILVDCGKDYRSKLLEDLPDYYKKDIEELDTVLNRKFNGEGLIRALGVEVHHALPYQPESKSIERMFGTIEREWISKEIGWCHNSVAERPVGFQKKLDTLLKEKKLPTFDEFVTRFSNEIIPAYHNFRETNKEEIPEGWDLALESMTPLERYHALPKPYLVTPDWSTLCLLKSHSETRKVRRQGVKYKNIYYSSRELSPFVGEEVRILYNEVEKPLIPNSISILANGEYLCEVYPPGGFPFYDADSASLNRAHDIKKYQKSRNKETIERIKKSTEGILPPEAEEKPLSIKAQLRDHGAGAKVDSLKETDDIINNSPQESPAYSEEAPVPAVDRPDDQTKDTMCERIKTVRHLLE